MKARAAGIGIVAKRNKEMGEPIITCKECNERFSRLEWMTNRTCTNPNCRCPEVAKAREAMNQVIDKAKEVTAQYMQQARRETIPTGYNENTDQYMCDVPDVLRVEVIVPKVHFHSKKGK